MNEFRTAWKVVVAAAIGVGVGITGSFFYTLGIFITPLSAAFGWSRGSVAAGSLFMVLSLIITAPLVGRLADRVGARRVAIVSLPLLACCLLAMTFAGPGINDFYLHVLVLAALSCGTTPIIWSRGVASWFDRQRGLALGITLCGTGLAGVLAPQYVNALIERYDWRAGYVGLAALAALAILPVSLWFKEVADGAAGLSAQRAASRGLTRRSAIRTLCFWQLGLGIFLVTGAVASLIVHLVPLLGDSGIPRNVAVSIAGVLGIAVIGGRLCVGYLIDRMHPPYVAAAFLLVPCIGCVILAASPETLWLVTFAVVTIGLAAGAEVDLLAFLTSRYFGMKAFGEIYGWLFVFFELGIGFGPLLAGHAHDVQGSYRLALHSCTAAFILGALTIGTMGAPPPRNTLQPA